MPRRLRLYRPGIPAHVVQRGHNRNPCFFASADYHRYKHALADALQRYGGALHAYCLMGNHVHLLLTPDHEDSISRIVQHVGREYVQYINKRYQRSGTLWEGRHKGSLVEAETYLLTCYRYIERNPVAAAMVNSAEQYPWSSYRHNALGEQDTLLTPHPVFLQMGKRPEDASKAYRDLFGRPQAAREVTEMQECLAANRVLGSKRFKTEMAGIFEQPVEKRRRGRPPG